MRRFYGPSAELREYAEATADDRGWRTYNELDEAVEALEGRVAGADCLLGFSQGANFASMLAARAERRGTPFRAVVLLCGARPGWARQLPGAFTTPLKTPAFVGAGRQDTVVGNGDDLAAVRAPGAPDARRGPPAAARGGRGRLRGFRGEVPGLAWARRQGGRVVGVVTFLY